LGKIREKIMVNTYWTQLVVGSYMYEPDCTNCHANFQSKDDNTNVFIIEH
jgi:hypothetical protein